MFYKLCSWCLLFCCTIQHVFIRTLSSRSSATKALREENLQLQSWCLGPFFLKIFLAPCFQPDRVFGTQFSLWPLIVCYVLVCYVIVCYVIGLYALVVSEAKALSHILSLPRNIKEGSEVAENDWFQSLDEKQGVGL